MSKGRPIEVMKRAPLIVGDTVVVLAGKDSGKRGKVLRFVPKKNRLVIEGVGMMKKHMKPTQQNPQGGIIEKEAPIHYSNVMLWDASAGKAGKPVRSSKIKAFRADQSAGTKKKATKKAKK